MIRKGPFLLLLISTLPGWAKPVVMIDGGRVQRQGPLVNGACIIALLCALFFTFSVQAAGGVALGATRVIYPAQAKQTSLSLSNSSDKARFLINAWVENDRGEKEKHVIVTPPLFVSEPKSENTLRIIYAGQPLPADRESLFWMNVKAIPSVNKQDSEGKNVLQLAVLSRIKLFVRPENLAMQPEDARAQLRFSVQNRQLAIHNASPYYLSLVNLKVVNEKLPNTMVAPHSTARVKIAGAPGRVVFQTVNDYGALTPEQQGVMQ